jgi:hypothetical protein
MKTRSAVSLFVAGLLSGICLMAGLGAESATPVKSPSHVQAFSYPSGGTGFFDPDAGTVYIYDANGVNCLMVRQLTTLGASMQRVRN